MDTKGEKTYSADLESHSPFNKTSVSQPAAAATKMQAEKEGADSSLRVSTVITESLAAPPRRAEFTGEGMTGAQVFANLCQDEGLAALFCAAGNYHIVNEIAQVGIPTYGGRTEGGMCSAADAFSRVTGEVVACSGTEGPGFTHMMMNIASAHAANTPLLVLASNTTLAREDSLKFIQFMYQQPLTQGMRKYGKRITAANRIYEYGAYAFRNLKSGVPGVVHLDFPEEIALARFKQPSELECYLDRERYRSESRPAPAPKEMEQAIEMIAKAERPVLVAGHGIFLRKAWDALTQAAEKHEMAVVGSGPVRGNFPDEHRLSASMSNDALMKADLVVFVGQYQMPTVGEYTFANGIKTIRVHPVQEEIGRNWPVDLGIVSDEKHFMESLANGLKPKKRDAWVNELAAAKQRRQEWQMELYSQFLKYTHDTGALHPFVLCKEVHDFLYKGKIDPKQTLTLWGATSLDGAPGRGCALIVQARKSRCPTSLDRWVRIWPWGWAPPLPFSEGSVRKLPTKVRRYWLSPGMADWHTPCLNWTPARNISFRSSAWSTATTAGPPIEIAIPDPHTCISSRIMFATTRSPSSWGHAASMSGHRNNCRPLCSAATMRRHTNNFPH